MARATSHGESINRGEFERLLSALLAFDHALVEFYMQIYGTPPHQQLAMRRQNRNLHGLVRKRVPEFLFGKTCPAKTRSMEKVVGNSLPQL